jgi:thymidylate kinase
MTDDMLDLARRAVASDSDWNHRLLGDLFDHVYRTMKTARGQRETVSSDRYLDGEAILTVVKQAIRKAEMDALDTWRKAAP